MCSLGSVCGCGGFKSACTYFCLWTNITDFVAWSELALQPYITPGFIQTWRRIPPGDQNQQICCFREVQWDMILILWTLRTMVSALQNDLGYLPHVAQMVQGIFPYPERARGDPMSTGKSPPGVCYPGLSLPRNQMRPKWQQFVFFFCWLRVS